MPSIRLAVSFLLHTYLRARRRSARETVRWLATVRELADRQPAAAAWLLRYLAGEEGQKNFRWVT